MLAAHVKYFPTHVGDEKWLDDETFPQVNCVHQNLHDTLGPSSFLAVVRIRPDVHLIVSVGSGAHLERGDEPL